MAIFQDYITLKQAAQISGYHSDYIGALIRSGKVKGKKVGRNWFVSEREVKSYFMTKHYVPAGRALFANGRGLLVAVFLFCVGGFASAFFYFSGETTTSNVALKTPAKSLTETVTLLDKDAQIGK